MELSRHTTQILRRHNKLNFTLALRRAVFQTVTADTNSRRPVKALKPINQAQTSHNLPDQSHRELTVLRCAHFRHLAIVIQAVGVQQSRPYQCLWNDTKDLSSLLADSLNRAHPPLRQQSRS